VIRIGVVADGPSARGDPSAAEALAADRLVELAYRSAGAGGAPFGVA